MKIIALLGIATLTTTAAAQYPTPPKPLPEAEEITLALSAAPEEVSSKSDVWVLRDTGYAKVRTGTNGGACMVGRDLHEGSRYPICFDREGAQTTLRREIMEGNLRARGKSEDEVIRAVEAATANGTLTMPASTALSYMMSAQQVLFSSPKAEGFRVGAWSPHVMILAPAQLSARQLGLAEQDSKVDAISIHEEGKHHSELVIKLPAWSNGTPVTRK